MHASKRPAVYRWSFTLLVLIVSAIQLVLFQLWGDALLAVSTLATITALTYGIRTSNTEHRVRDRTGARERRELLRKEFARLLMLLFLLLVVPAVLFTLPFIDYVWCLSGLLVVAVVADIGTKNRWVRITAATFVTTALLFGSVGTVLYLYYERAIG